MKSVSLSDLSGLKFAQTGSHKGQNGRLLIIGGSHLFHAASIWALEVASRIVDLVHYSSVPENNALVKQEFLDGIVVARDDVDAYIEEDDVILIGPGMTRDTDTKMLTDRVLQQYPNKQWVIDAGALQMMDLSLIPQNAILTPHHGEFAQLWAKYQVSGITYQDEVLVDQDKVKLFAKEHHCIVLLKGHVDVACSGGACDENVCTPGECFQIEGGNEGMTKGGTGDVLAGLIAALATKNDPMLSTIAGSYINKQAGEELYKTVGPFFNASDLAGQIPKTMKKLFIMAHITP